MGLNILLIIGGLVLLVKGADWFVEGASSLAKKFNVSELAIGLTIVAFGTSAPELVVNTFASYQKNPDIIFGNVIGSNNFNLFIILGIAGLITPLTVQSSTAWKEIPFSLFAAALVFLLVSDYLFFGGDNGLSRLDGLILAVFFLLFLFYVYNQLKTDSSSQISTEHEKMSSLKTGLFIAGGLAGLVIGGKLVVNGAVDLARILNVSEKIIGLTIVAAGTSLPELATSVIAALKKNSDIAVGNIVGSNIFNLLLILSVSSFVRPIDYNLIFNTDMYILAGGTVFLFVAMYTGKRKKLDRWEAFILLAFYLTYTVYLVGKEI